MASTFATQEIFVTSYHFFVRALHTGCLFLNKTKKVITLAHAHSYVMF